MEDRLRNLVVDRLFPRFCAACNKEGSLWCASCEQIWSFRPLEQACGFCHREGSSTTCHPCRSSTFLDGLITFGPYANPVIRTMLRSWKYVGDRSAEPILQQWLFRSADRLHPPMDPFFVVPIPLHVKRERTRGFNQAHVLAHWIEQMYGLPVLPVLERSIHTESQALVTGRDRRLGELDSVFSLNPHFVEDGVPNHILLCDDVFTSGATMDAAAERLKQAGAKNVWGFVIAKGR